MNKLSNEEKMNFVGGARGKASQYTKLLKKFGLNKTKVKTYKKQINNAVHNISLANMALATSGIGIYEIFKEKFTEEVEQKNYQKTYRSSSASPMSIRPMMRFGDYPSRTTVGFGLPWYY